MRLLHTARLEFREFFDEGIPPYAILSHRWGTVDEEVSFAEFKARTKKTTPGYAKIKKFCGLSRQRGFEYCWIDTCCIDKSSSAELTEAINSMYRWYEQSQVCFVHLKDVSDISNLTKSEWFERGWTLQELIAPKTVEFFKQDWQHLGTKIELCVEIAAATNIGKLVLTGDKSIESYSVAARMSWAAHRKTSRLEDQAYSLLGLFNVNMPLLYGEGSKAYQRLQQEIYANLGDTSLFVWGLKSSGDRLNPTEVVETKSASSILAPSPAAFRNCSKVLLDLPSTNIFFEMKRRELTILVHRIHYSNLVQKLMAFKPKTYLVPNSRHTVAEPLLLNVPLACLLAKENASFWENYQYFCASLELAYHLGSWYKRGVSWRRGRPLHVQERMVVDDNDYVRIHIPLHSTLSSSAEKLAVEQDAITTLDFSQP